MMSAFDVGHLFVFSESTTIWIDTSLAVAVTKSSMEMARGQASSLMKLMYSSAILVALPTVVEELSGFLDM